MSERLEKKNSQAALIKALLQVNQRLSSSGRAGFVNQFAPTSGDAKHSTAWADYGYPSQLLFDHSWSMFRRFGLARAGIMRPVETTWRTSPVLLENDQPHEKTIWEKQVAALAKRLMLWQRLRGVDYRNRVGRYAALLLTVKDGKPFSEPLLRQSGPAALVSVKPLYESQLTVTSWVDDTTALDHGQPSMYQLDEAVIGDRSETTNRALAVHPSRVIIWAEGADDGTIFGIPALESGFNDLITLEKIIGAGGEGFWKNARSSLNMDISPDAPLQQLATALGTDLAGLPDALSDQVEDYASGVDKQLMTQGIDVKPLTVNIPIPEKYFEVALQDYASSLPVPLPILLGLQISQRSSDGNDKDWAATITSRREQFVAPSIDGTIRRFMELGFIDVRPDFVIEWDDLTAPTASEKLDLGVKMADINQKMVGSGQMAPFSSEQVVEASGFEMDEGNIDDVPEGDDDDE